jgi:cobyrinic acid a,c-diamide synthase
MEDVVMKTCGGKLVIAGTGSGVGKTSITLGLIRALSRRGLIVQPFKVGPDFLDPTHLSLAAGRPCYNLDGWMTGESYVQSLFDRMCDQADIAIVEGVMGMFDGASPSSLSGSTAEIACWLDAPVLLVVGAHGVARSIAAVVKGFAEFDANVRLAGVIANHTGTHRHRTWLAEALDNASLPALVGAIPRDALPKLADRHLGLITADANTLPETVIDALADACETHLDIDAIVKLAAPSKPKPAVATVTRAPAAQARIGVARDDAFHFCYRDNLEAFERSGARIVPFSPISDRQLPPDLGGLYLPGGYPEEHADALAANETMLADIRNFADSGKCIYAECGGLIYLGRSVQTRDGRDVPLAGVLPIDSRMLTKRKFLGYVEVTLKSDSLWGPAGDTLRGHEFHYSEIYAEDFAAQGWHEQYAIQSRAGQNTRTEGFAKGNILASYIHLHWASAPQATANFIQRCKEAS